MTNDPFRKTPADNPSDPSDPSSVGSAAGRDQDPEIVEGEIVEDAAAGPYRGEQAGRDPVGDNAPGGAGPSWRSPFEGESPFAGAGGPAGLFGVDGPGAFGTLRLLASNSPELRSMMTAPLRILTVVVLVPSLVSLLFGLTIDGGARFVAFGIAVLGGVAGLVLELRRRQLVKVPAPSRAGDPARRNGVGNLVGVIGFSLLMTMLAAGFDVLALLLVIFGVW